MSYTLTIDAPDGQIVLRDRQVISVGPEHHAAGGEVPNMSIDIDNARGQHTRLFARTPLGAGAALAYSLWLSAAALAGNPLWNMDLYYESAAVVLTLVMLGRYLELSSRSKTYTSAIGRFPSRLQRPPACRILSSPVSSRSTV